MRLALLTHSRRRVGGVESYLETLAAGLTSRGHAVALFSENDVPDSRPPIRLPADAADRSLGGVTAPLDDLRDWRPDALFTHGLLDPGLEARLLTESSAGDGIPTVALLHGYYGACVSGHKAWSAPHPMPRPCPRPFGAGCLVHYYPHRCGGLDPRTMWRDYRVQSRRRRLLARYDALAVFSGHMAREYARLGLHAEVLPPLPTDTPGGDEQGCSSPPGTPEDARRSPFTWETDNPLRLLYLGRMEPLKGGATLLDALGQLLAAANAANSRYQLDFAGQGSAEADWRRRAARLEARFPGRLTVRFHGWLGVAGREELLATAHLLVVPSLWPEPLGLVGAEAAAWGVPAVAFAVGGIPEWLRDGENGVLAPGNPPTPARLADALRRATVDPVFYAALRAGARRAAADPVGRAARHYAALEALFGRAQERRKAEGGRRNFQTP